MSDTFTASSDRTVFHLMAVALLVTGFGHCRQSSDDYELAYDIGKKAGNLQYAAYAFGHNMYCRFFQVSISRRSSKKPRNRWPSVAPAAINGRWICSKRAHELSSNFPIPTSIRIKATIRKRNSFNRLESNQNHQVLCIYNVMQSFSCLVLKDFERALKYSNSAESNIYMVGTQGLLPCLNMLRFEVLSRHHFSIKSTRIHRRGGVPTLRAR